MKLVSINAHTAILIVPQDEVRMLVSLVNEALECAGDSELQTKTNEDPQAVGALLDEMHGVFYAIKSGKLHDQLQPLLIDGYTSDRASTPASLVKLIALEGAMATILMSRRTLRVLNSLIRIVLESLEDPEFQTRVGEYRESVVPLLEEIEAIADTMD